MDVGSLLVGVLFAGVGAYLLIDGGRSLELARAIRATDPVSVRELVASDEPLEFEGTAELLPDDDPIEAPYSGRETVCHEYRIREKRRRHSGSGGSRSSWTTAESGTETRPFVVDDGTGRVEVDPDDAALDGDWQTVETEGTVGLFDGKFNLTVSGFGSRPRHYQERRLEPGDPVHVYGARVATERGGWDDDVEATVAADADASDFSLAVGTETDAVRSHLRSGLGSAALGVVLVGVGALTLLGWI